MKTAFELEFPRLMDELYAAVERLEVTDDETKLFEKRFMHLMWDKTWFQSCFDRNLIRDEVYAIMLFKYVSEGRRLGIFKKEVHHE